MSKSIKSIPVDVRFVAIQRRIRNKTGGLGFWAAVDAARRLGQKVEDLKNMAPPPTTPKEEE